MFIKISFTIFFFLKTNISNINNNCFAIIAFFHDNFDSYAENDCNIYCDLLLIEKFDHEDYD